MNKVTLKIRIKNWWNEHKAGIIGGVITTGSAILLALVYGKGYSDGKRIGMHSGSKNFIDIPDESDLDTDHLYPNASSTKMVDEDIFTNIAPQIEDAILNDDINDQYISTNYDLEYPDDSEDGYHTVTKELEINIKTM